MRTQTEHRQSLRDRLELQRISLALLDEGKPLPAQKGESPEEGRRRSHLRRSIFRLEALLAKLREERS